MEDKIIRKNKFTLSKKLKYLIWYESLTQRRSVSRVSLSREPKTMILCESLTQRTNVSRVSLIIIITTIIFAFTGKEAYAQVDTDINKEQDIEEMTNSNNDIDILEVPELFTVDNNTYKVLDLDHNTVMFWKCEKPDDLGRIIINSKVNYNGRNYIVKYVYEKAFYNSSRSEKNINIEDGVLGFCDISGQLVESLTGVFADQKKLETVNLGNTNYVFGENCFRNCSSILTVKIPSNMDIVEGKCFDKCSSIKNIDLSVIKEFNGQSAFANCSKLEDIGKFSDEVIELPDKTFISCTNLKINSLNNITKLGNECFEYCKVLNKNIVTDVEEIGDKCFLGCSFSEVYLKKAKKVGYNAFGTCGALEKIRFGNLDIPDIADEIVENSTVNEWIYPLSYKTQPAYLNFLSKLKASKVIWYSNYGNQERVVTYKDKLNTLKEPSIKRDGYEIEGWYKESECLNKVNMIADLGEISDLDIVIKNPVLYAKWISKENQDEESNPDTPQVPDNSEEPTNPDIPEVPDNSEEPTNPDAPEVPDNSGEPTNPNTPELPDNSEEPTNSDTPEVPANSGNINNSNKSKNNSNNIEDIIIKNEEKNEIIDIEETNKPYLGNEIIKNIIFSDEKSDMKIKNIKWSFKDTANGNIEIINSGILSTITENNKCIGMYLQSNGDFKDNTTIGIDIKDMMMPNKLYSYSNELGKFILINDTLQINDSIIKFKPNNKKEFLITNFDLNEDNIARQGWNKIFPQQNNAVLSKEINEISWVYLQGQELSKGWIKDISENNWYFINDKGIMETGWLKYKDNKWYYLNTISDGSKGAMKIGWYKINDEWYHFKNDGTLAVNTNIDGYLVGDDGKLI